MTSGPTQKELTVERINIVDGDGTVRLVLSNKDRFPAPVANGEPLERQGPSPAGLIFYNDEGDECGGLTFHGKDGTAGALLAFDKYGGNEVISLSYTELSQQSYYGLTLVPQPMGWPGGGAFIGFGRDGSKPSIQLADSKGRTRIRLAIGEDDNPVVEVLDEEGNAVSSLIPAPER